MPSCWKILKTGAGCSGLRSEPEVPEVLKGPRLVAASADGGNDVAEFELARLLSPSSGASCMSRYTESEYRALELAGAICRNATADDPHGDGHDKHPCWTGKPTDESRWEPIPGSGHQIMGLLAPASLCWLL